MPFKKILATIAIALFFVNCEDDIRFVLKSPKKININKQLEFEVTEENGNPSDSIHFFLDGKRTSKTSLDISKEVLGFHTISAVVYYQGTSKKLINRVYFLADRSPKIYTYTVVNTFPHDPNAFTQGLEFYNGYLYESTGQHGKSSIRKTDYKTGKILQIKNIDEKYFGEGITIFDNQIHHLTWQSKIGFVYDLETFKKKSSFKYGKSLEGWGFTHNSKELIKSDGTERLWFLDPKTHKETHFIEAYTNKRKAERLNEIEYINGKIYANIWQKNTIIIIDENNGTIEGVINLNGLSKMVQKVSNNNDYVLNGIAYDAENDRLFVTGKNWNKTFEIKIQKK